MRPEGGESVVERLMTALEVRTLPALAEALGESLGAVKSWSARGSVPLAPLSRAARKTGRSLDWLVLGSEPIRLAQASTELEQKRQSLSHLPSPSRAAANAPIVGAFAAGLREAAGASVLVAEQESATWRLSASVDTLAPPKARERSSLPRSRAAERALFPVHAAQPLRPLVLRLAVNGGDSTVDYEVIPRVLGVAAAGEPRDKRPATQPPVIDRAGECAFSYDWLSRNLHHTTGDIVTIQVAGDSMSPTLIDGETIMIDRGVREIEVDGIYVVHLGGRRLVKRIQRKFDGTLVIISDNQAYERETISRGHVQDVVVLGRMVWPRVR